MSSPTQKKEKTKKVCKVNIAQFRGNVFKYHRKTLSLTIGYRN